MGLILAAAWLAYSTRAMLKTWPVANAQLMSSRTRSYVHRNEKRQRDYTHFEVIVEFRYSAAGRSYLTPSAKDYTSSKDADQALALYAPGSRHEIGYNPADPNEIRLNMDSGIWLGCHICLALGRSFPYLVGRFSWCPACSEASLTVCRTDDHEVDGTARTKD